MTFGKENNVIIAAERSFEDIVTTMQEQGVVDPKGISEYEFYAKLKYYEKKFKTDK